MEAICGKCGQKHDELALAIPVSAPTQAAMIPTEERTDRVWTNGELCVVDDEYFFLYGSISLPIHGHDGEFSWGAWVRVDEETFFWCQDLLDEEGREKNAPFNASLGTDIPFYDPPTLDLPLEVHIQPLGLRPLFRLADLDHPLAEDQRHGVSPERVEEFKRWFDALRSGRA